MVDCLSLTLCNVGRANGQHQSHTKRCLEFENNAIGHTTFAGMPTMLAGLTIHVQLTLLVCLLYHIN